MLLIGGGVLRGLYFPSLCVAMGGAAEGGKGGERSPEGSSVCVKQQYSSGVGMVKHWNRRLAVLYFDDQLCCILTHDVCLFLWCSSGK